jgi:hypothetical protein
VERALSVLLPNQKKLVRNEIIAYCMEAEKFRLSRDYSQRRPVRGYGLSAGAEQEDDCSGFCSKVFYWVGQRTHLHLADPLGFRYSGYGNTQSLIDWMGQYATPVDKYLTGDFALWGADKHHTHHVAICKTRGTSTTALFTSHGHESSGFPSDAPNTITLDNFPQRLIGVYRHPQLR